MIRFRCQECGKKLKADDDIVGRKVKCTRCGKVEKVPPSDNLTKPNPAKTNPAKEDPAKEDDFEAMLESAVSAEDEGDLIGSRSVEEDSSKRLDANKPKPIRKKSTSFKMGPSDLIAGEEPVEMMGHSGPDVSIDTEKFQPQFKSTKPKKSNLRRNVIFGLIGLGLIGGIAVVSNLGWILDAKRKLSTDYENLEEVKFYRNAVAQTERARRQMKIAGDAYLKIKSGTAEEEKSLQDYNDSIESQTTKSDMLERVETLFRAGEDNKAKALLVNTGVELGKVKKEIELKTQEYTDKTY